ncbi:Heme A synthase cytochrome oxidase biogenesis protein Cox15-CtaA [Paramagnetospirillum magnetotacticum MS-1]|uniref:Heme A synthase n=2 Tax=Paramagnetospirillum magnetotacticum TaxID=188 RepID=A0A0C2UZQ1_PARME|nr:Heme A synthase cytochrome oxidase biogenesis protein Cox15-CtaA [Paramagnetospirillum magnetotacticum MS-1]
MSRSFGRSDLANGAHRDVAVWLLACCFMVAVMVLLGGLTRLTHSGLSMVEWEPIRGIIPPLGDSDWQLFFEKYKQSPEYIKVNAGMSLAEFRGIFWLEYIHRVWGRLIGVVFGLPFLWLALSGRIGRAMVPRLAGVFLLGAAQGGMGWFMVKSGLVDNPAVSHYRLTAHLALAFLIHGWMFWLALDILADHRPIRRRVAGETAGIRSWLFVLTGLVILTLLFGGLVAGLKAGLIYNTWPLMDGALIPKDLFPDGFHSLFEDIKTVQFGHRTLAELTVVVALLGWFRARARLGGQTPAAIHALGLMALVQVGLGIGTLVMVVPVWLASAHQMGAMALLTLCLWALHDLDRRL